MTTFEDLITAYRERFKEEPPLFGPEKTDLIRRIQDALRTGLPITYKDLGVPDDAFVSPTLKRTWREGPVGQAQEHFEVWYGQDTQTVLVARVCATKSGPHSVEFLRDSLPVGPERDRVLDELLRELDFYLMKPFERDIRKYMRYHCTTAANVYGGFYWALVDPKDTVSKR